MKHIWDLENSEDVLERQEYAERIKMFFIPETVKNLKVLEEKLEFEDNNNIEWLIKRHKEFIKAMKIKLSNYDIYNQKLSCYTCHEVECVCGEIEEEIKKLF